MIKNLDEILPEEISDETAYYIVNFFMDLALALESHYFSRIMRHEKGNEPLSFLPTIAENPPNENDF